MKTEIQVMVRFSPSARKQLRQAKNITGMTEKAIMNQAFTQWWSSKKKEMTSAE